MSWLTQMGFTVVEHSEVTKDTIEKIIQEYQKSNRK